VLLAVHVVRLRPAEFAEARGNLEDVIGVIDVHMDLCFALGTGQHQRVAEFRERLPQFAPVDVFAGNHAFGAVAIPGFVIGFRKLDCWFIVMGEWRIRKRHNRAVTQVLLNPGDHFGKTLRARVNHARFAQYVELIGCVGQRLFDALHRVTDDRWKVPLPNGTSLVTYALGKRGDHRQYCALARLRQGIVRVLVAQGHGFGKSISSEACNLARGVAHALEELRHDRTGISTSTVEKRVCDRRQHRTEVLLSRLAKNAEGRPQRQAEIGSRVAVGNGKHVDAIQKFLLGEHTMNP
jgi:hypothetical protein